MFFYSCYHFFVVILGIDPGLRSTGYGAVRCENSTFRLIESGFIETSGKMNMALRLGQLHTELNRILKRTSPDYVCVENVFSLVRYPKAAILLGQVMGIVYLTLFQKKIDYLEITPKEIKNAVVGYGNANKGQIKKAVMRILGLERMASSHASDAIAAALAAFYRIKRSEPYDKISERSAFESR